MPGQARILTFEEIARIHKVLPTARDKALFALGIYAGLRIGEIVQLRRDQVCTAAGGIRNILKIKRSKRRNKVVSDIPTHSKLRDVLTKYREELDVQGWLFPSNHSRTGHLTRAQAHNILKNAFESLGLEDVSPHSMRLTFLTSMSRAGVPLRTIQEISGQTSLSASQASQANFAVDPDDLRRAINLLGPLIAKLTPGPVGTC
jgi:integrase/recombinase XerD